jgi:phosphatidylglycerol lysyltransferase
VTGTGRQPGRWISAVLGSLLFVVALLVLRRELATVRFADVRAALGEISRFRVFLAFLFSTAHYIVLTSYEQLGFLHIKKEMLRWKVLAASWLGYAISNSVGVPILSGTTVRYRFYSRWGLNNAEFTRLVVFYSTAFVLGMVVIGGGGLVFLPPERGSELVQVPLKILGMALLSCAPGYVVLCAIRRRPIRFGGVDLHLPTPRLAVTHLALSVADWVLGASIVYALMPEGDLPWTIVFGAFIFAQLLGLISNIPGGVGIFEGTIVLLLGSHVEQAELVSALLLYRFIYYLLPLVFALTVLILDEAWIRRRRIASILGFFRRKSRRKKNDHPRADAS